MPCTARWTFANVNSSAITARHPEVPNLICVAIAALVFSNSLIESTDRMNLGCIILYDGQTTCSYHVRLARRSPKARAGARGTPTGRVCQHRSTDRIGVSLA